MVRDIENEHELDKGGSGMLPQRELAWGEVTGFFPCPSDETHLYGDTMVKWK